MTEEQLRELAEELVTTWVNGNRRDVREVLETLHPIQAAYVAVCMASVWPDALDDLTETLEPGLPWGPTYP
jgi:hypothetical protein